MFPLVTVCEKILFAGLEIRMSSLVLLVFPRVPSCRMTERAIGYLRTHVIVKGQQNCLSHIFCTLCMKMMFLSWVCYR